MTSLVEKEKLRIIERLIPYAVQYAPKLVQLTKDLWPFQSNSDPQADEFLEALQLLPPHEQHMAYEWFLLVHEIGRAHV